MADDEGRFLASINAIVGYVFPNDDMPVRDVQTWLDECVGAHVVQLYRVDNVRYGVIPTFRKHQRISHPMRSVLPEPCANIAYSEQSPCANIADSEKECANEHYSATHSSVHRQSPQNVPKLPECAQCTPELPCESNSACLPQTCVEDMRNDSAHDKEWNGMEMEGEEETKANALVLLTSAVGGNEHAQKSIEAEFTDTFWLAYPNKAGKKRALDAYRQARKRTSAEIIMAGVIRYRDDPNRNSSFTKHASTWLNGDCWDDPLLPPRRANSRASEQAEFIQALANLPAPNQNESDLSWMRQIIPEITS